jgi:hypothetical protein
MGTNWVRHLIIGMGSLVLFGFGTILWNWSTFSIMFRNMNAVSEGADEAEQIRSPADFASYLALHPDQASIIAYTISDPVSGLYHNPDRRRPVVGLERLITLSTYANSIEVGTLRSDQPVAVQSVRAFFHPDLDRGSHAAALKGLNLEGADTLKIHQIAEAMIGFHDRSANDWLVTKLGQDALNSTLDRLGMQDSDEPKPLSILYKERLASVRQTDPSKSKRIDLFKQREWAHQVFPKGTAQDYAWYMQKLALISNEATGTGAIEKQALERTVPGDSTRVLATLNGSFPGIISFAGYIQSREEEEGRVVVFLLEDVSMGVFYHLMQTGIDKGFVLQLLLDADFARDLADRL